MKISLIVAHGKKREIGLEGKMPWALRDDLKFFKETTLGHTLIMGRKTFESIGRPLPGRKTIVISRTIKEIAGVAICSSLEDALNLAKSEGEEEVFIAGGGMIYEKALPLVEKLYLSLVSYEGKADTYFPNYKLDNYDLVAQIDFSANERNQYSFSVLVYQKKDD